MQRDEPSYPSQTSQATGPGVTSFVVRGWQQPWARHVALGGLVLATSLAVAAYASLWLVPPYLALMAWLLWPPANRRARAAGAEASRTLAPIGDERLDEGFVDPSASAWDVPTRSESATDLSAAAGADSNVTATALKPKRSRSRARKAKPAPVVEAATQVTWIRVGPGKFVRVEGANPLVADVAPVAEAPRDLAEAVSPLPTLETVVPPDEAETACAVDAPYECEAPAEVLDTGTTDVELSAADASEWQHPEPPECTDEASEPPKAADVLPASYAQAPEPELRVEVVEDAEFGPDPVACVDSVDAPVVGNDAEPDEPIPDVAPAVCGLDACEATQDAPSPTAAAPSISDGPSTGSAGRALWVAHSRSPRFVLPLAKRSPSRRARRAGRARRVVRTLPRPRRREYVRRAHRIPHARSPPGS